MRKIELTQGKIAIVDDRDFPMVINYKWYAFQSKQDWYAQTHIKKNNKRTSLQMHRLITGVLSGIEIDHIDHNGLNNRRSNLRFATNQQNSFNRKSHIGSSSKYKGVSWNNLQRKWVVQIAINGKGRHIGYFANEKDAALAYNKVALRLFGNFAYLNDI